MENIKEDMIDVRRIIKEQMNSVAERYFNEGSLPNDLSGDYEMVWKYINGLLNGAISREDFENTMYSLEDFSSLVHIKYTKKVWVNTLKKGQFLRLTGGQEVAELALLDNDTIRVEYYTLFFLAKNKRTEGKYEYFNVSTDKDILDVCFKVKEKINGWFL